MSAELDARLRRAFAGIDCSAGFEAVIAARIAQLPVDRADQRERLEREHARDAKRFVREAWMDLASALGIGAAAIAVVWRHGASVARWMEDVLAVAANPEVVTPAAMAVLAAGLWPVLKTLMPR